MNKTSNRHVATLGILSTIALVVSASAWAAPMMRDTDASSASDPAAAGAPFAVVADLNADGTLDLVMLDREHGDISVRLGRGDGTFEPENRFHAGNGSAWVAVGDLDGDGNADLVDVLSDSDTLRFFMGYGDGTFGRETSLSAGDRPTAVVVADFDGDGRQDLAITNAGGGDISLLRAAGDPAQDGIVFGPEKRFKTGREPRALAVGDFNNDGRQDLVVSNGRSKSVSILLGAPGDVAFLGQERLRVGKTPDTVVVADFNDDQVQDLAVVNRGSGDMSVLIGLGGGRFKVDSRYGFLGPVVSIAAADFDSDHLVDLAVVVGGHDVYFLKSQGDGSFRSTSTELGFAPLVLSVGDFDADGKQDLLTAQGPDVVSAWLGRGNGAFVSRAPSGSGR